MSVFRDHLHVDETEGERFDLFLDLLASGEVVVFQGIALAIRNGTLEVDVPSSQRSGRVSEEQARRELDAAAVTIETLAQSSQRFHSVAEHLPRRLILIDDYGNGAVALAELEGGSFHLRAGSDPPAP